LPFSASRWRIREALVVGGVVLLVVATTTGLHLARLGRVVVEEAERQGALIARQIYAQSGRAIARIGAIDASDALRHDPDMRSLVDASVGYSPHIVHVLVAHRSGTILVHSEKSREGQPVPDRPTLRELLETDPVRRFKALYDSGRIYETVLPMNLDGEPFASVRVGFSTALLRREMNAAVGQSLALAGLALAGAWAAALILASVMRRPIRQMVRDVSLLRRVETPGELPPGRSDEVDELAAQLQLLGRELQSDRVKALAERAHMQHVVDILEDGMIFFTPDRRILSYNRAAESAIGRPIGEGAGLRLEELLERTHPLRITLEPAFHGEQELRNATVTLTIEGHPKELLVSAFFVADVERSVGAMVLLRDLDSIRTLQSLISYSAKLAALGRLTSGVAHEVKNPLNAMMIHLELVRQSLETAPDGVQESIDVIDGEIRRLDRVVQGFLRFVRPQELHLKQVDLGMLLQSVAALLEAGAQTAGVRIELALDPRVPPVSADEELLRQAFLNILQNACQAMPTGGTVTVSTTIPRPDWVAVSVADEGVGIPAADLDRIFSLYYTTKPDGNGIGLSVVFRTVQMHDGHIDVASEPGRGTTMTVRLPLRT
jgi:signal transduction histidine kinase